MGTIGPIMDRKIIEMMKENLRDKNFRNYLMFRIGLNFGLSVQELLRLRIEDIVDRDVFVYRNCQVQIPRSLKYEIDHYIGNQKEGFLFTSTSGSPLSRFQLYMVLQNSAKDAGYRQAIGAITLRKTFAYWAYQEKKDYLPTLSRYLNHQTTKHTLKYLGLEENEEPEESLIIVEL